MGGSLTRRNEGEGEDRWEAAPKGEPSGDTLVDQPSRSDVRAIMRRPTVAEDRLGDVVMNRYELVHVLGSGSSGSVFEARDMHKRESVAIKLLHEHLRTSDGHVARFAREVRATSA